MKRLRSLGVVGVIVLIIGAVCWWIIVEGKEKRNALNKADVFVHYENGKLYWFKVHSRKGKVEGIRYQQEIKEERDNKPFIEEKELPLTGKITGEGFTFELVGNKEIYDAKFAGDNLLVQKEGEASPTLYKAVTLEELDTNVKKIQDEFQLVLDQSEQKFKERLHQFFTELKSVYGYLYTSEDGALQVFLRIDEALLQGELSGSLLMMVNTGNRKQLYKESRYEWSGITDGFMVELFTTVDGKQTKLEGGFQETENGLAGELDLTFWTTDQKLTFHAVTENQFTKCYKEFKANTRGKK